MIDLSQIRELAVTAAAVTGVITGIVGLFTVRRVLVEVKTANAQTIGALLGATETRRVGQIPEADRTVGEIEHMEQVNEKGEAIKPHP